MANIIGRDGVQSLIRANVQLIDVLPQKEFSEGHLPGAINIPLTQVGGQARLSSKPATDRSYFDLQ